MKKKYIKPTISGIITLTKDSLLDTASSYNAANYGKVTEDDSPDDTEVDAAAKGNSTWEEWDEY